METAAGFSTDFRIMRIHFIAIGGAAMHNLALALHDAGHLVTGSDDDIRNPSQQRLAEAGLLPEALGWHASRITPDIDVVILGMHARADNPELTTALSLGLNVQSYPEFLFQATADKHRVVVGGSHGKTTITSMVLHVLHALRRPTDFMVGAQLDGFDRMVGISADNDLVVLEGDEYLSSPLDRRSKFLWYKPQTALLTGIAWDHINVFPTEKDYTATFDAFVQSLPEAATLVHCEEDSLLGQTIARAGRPDLHLIPYATPKDVAATDGITAIRWPDGGETTTGLKGTHNLQNLSGARALCGAIGLSPADFDSAISTFSGAARRLELVVDDPAAAWTVYRDFAHAPSKVRATTAGIRDAFAKRRLVAAFELHTFSSLNPDFLPTYAGALNAANAAAVYYDPSVVAAKRLPPLSPDQVREAFQRPDLEVFTVREDLVAFLNAQPREDAVVVLMSSGWFGGAVWPESS